MDRQQAIGLLLEPLLSLFMLAVRTVPVAARASHPVLMAAVVAFKDHMTQFARSTSLNRTQDFALVKSDFVSTLLKKRLAMLPQTVGDGRHVAAPGSSRPTKQRVNHFACIGHLSVRQMQIDHRRLQTAVTEKLLNLAQGDTGFQQMSRIAVSERMSRYFLGEIDLPGNQFHRVLHRSRTHWR